MTDAERLRTARLKLGLSATQMAHMLGYQGNSARQMVWEIENDRKPLMPCQGRLLDAYDSGYRPKDWPLPLD